MASATTKQRYGSSRKTWHESLVVIAWRSVLTTMRVVQYFPWYSPRRLPLVLEPDNGESFSFWIRRYAWAFQCSVLEFVKLAGLNVQQLSAVHGIALAPNALSNLEWATGIDGSRFTDMLLTRYDGTALSLHQLDLANPGSLRVVARRQWADFRGSRCCPECVRANPAWPTWWRLSWAVVCPLHRRLLIEICDGCGMRLGQGSSTWAKPETKRVLDSTLCGNRTEGIQHCDAPIAELAIGERVDESMVSLQINTLNVANGDAAHLGGAAVTPLEFFACLRVLCALARCVWLPEDALKMSGIAADAVSAFCVQRDASPHYFDKPADIAQAAALLHAVAPVITALARDALLEELNRYTVRLNGERRERWRRALRGVSIPSALGSCLTELLPHRKPTRSLGLVLDLRDQRERQSSSEIEVFAS